MDSMYTMDSMNYIALERSGYEPFALLIIASIRIVDRTVDHSSD
jgi:hypothetical protein